ERRAEEAAGRRAVLVAVALLGLRARAEVVLATGQVVHVERADGRRAGRRRPRAAAEVEAAAGEARRCPVGGAAGAAARDGRLVVLLARGRLRAGERVQGVLDLRGHRGRLAGQTGQRAGLGRGVELVHAALGEHGVVELHAHLRVAGRVGPDTELERLRVGA